MSVVWRFLGKNLKSFPRASVIKRWQQSGPFGDRNMYGYLSVGQWIAEWLPLPWPPRHLGSARHWKPFSFTRPQKEAG